MESAVDTIQKIVIDISTTDTVFMSKAPETKIVTPLMEQQIITASDRHELVKVTVEAIQTENKHITPTTEDQEINPKENVYFKKITVDGVTAAIDVNITPENIREGTSVLGVLGTMKPDKPDQTKIVEPSIYEQEITADEGFDLGKVIVREVTKEPGMDKYHIQQIDLGNNECELRITTYNGESDDNYYIADFFEGDIMTLSGVSPYLINRGGK